MPSTMTEQPSAAASFARARELAASSSWKVTEQAHRLEQWAAETHTMEHELPRQLGFDVPEQEVIRLVAEVLDRSVELSKKKLLSEIPPSIFDDAAPSTEPIAAFLDRIVRSGLCSKECFIIALIYGDRLLRRFPHFVISARNVHRLTLLCILVASKALDDFYCRNVFYALAGGVSKTQLNAMELELCSLLNFELNVTSDEFNDYCHALFPGCVPSGARIPSDVVAADCSPVAPPSPAVATMLDAIPSSPARSSPALSSPLPAVPVSMHPHPHHHHHHHHQYQPQHAAVAVVSPAAPYPTLASVPANPPVFSLFHAPIGAPMAFTQQPAHMPEPTAPMPMCAHPAAMHPHAHPHHYAMPMPPAPAPGAFYHVPWASMPMPDPHPHHPAHPASHPHSHAHMQHVWGAQPQYDMFGAPVAAAPAAAAAWPYPALCGPVMLHAPAAPMPWHWGGLAQPV